MNTFNRFFVTGLLTGLSLIYASTAVAEQQQNQQQYQQQPRERSYGEKLGEKALNGIVNIHTAPLEMPKSIINNINTSGGNIVYGVIGGVLEGTLNTMARAVIGASDLILAPLPTRPIIQPQYVWDDFYETKTTYGDIFRLDSNEQQPQFKLPGQGNGTKNPAAGSGNATMY